MLDNEPNGVPGDEPEQTRDLQEAAGTAATNEGGEAPKRPRRRAASRPAGPPQPKADDTSAAPAGATASTDGAESPAEPETKPKRARKTAAKKVAAPEPADDADGESAPAAKKTTRTRTRKKADEAPDAGAQQAAEGGAAVAGEATEASDEAAATGTPSRATRASRAKGRTATRGGSTAAEGAEHAEEVAGQAEEVKGTGAASEADADQPTTRRSRTRSRRTAEPSETAEAAESGEAAATTGRPAPAAEPTTEPAARAALSSPFANPFAAPQLPAKTAKQEEAATEQAEQPKRGSRADRAKAGRADQAAQADRAADAKSEGKPAKAEPKAGPRTEAEPEAEAKPAKTRTRRRAASAPAGPPPAHDESAAEQAAEEAVEETAPEQVDLDSLSPADRARAVIAARAAAPAAAGVLFQAPDLTTAAAQQAAAKAAKAEAGAAEEAEPEEEEAEPAPTRRTRTRSRGRNRGEQAEAAEPTGAATAESESAEEEDEDEEGGTSSSRRRRRRRRRAGGEAIEASPDDPPNTVVKVRESRVRSRDRKGGLVLEDDVQGVRGSTRLEAKKQRRREGRDTGRRRAPLITEAEFLARRESVERVMVVRQSGDRTQIGVLEDGVLVEHYVNRAQSASYVGNVYLGKVQNVLPSMEAAFVDIGKGRNAVLYAGEVNFDAAGVTGQAKRIESVLKSGQAVLTQVTKDPIGHKGARLTSQISLPGRYLVYVPEGTMTGISRKLPENERNRLKAILKAVVPENAGVIVRTAAEGATEDELRRDVERLSAQWEEIQRRAQSSASSAPTLLYGEPDLTVRVVRDIFNEDFSQLIVSGDQAWDTIRDYVGGVAPDLAPRMERWTSEQDVFAVHRVDEQLAKGLDRKVWLPSGGSLVIDRTEAMVVIDVNTGKFTGSGGNLEETVTRNNIEAAEEIVRQLRLRDLGGIIVIDFIDMVLESNRDLVMRRLLECLGRDRTKHQVAEVTSLGLVQMTRKRVGQGLLEAFSETCDKCNGRGVLVHMEPVPVGHGHDEAQHDRGGKGQGGQAQPGRGGKAGNGAESRAGEIRAESGAGHDDEHEGGRGRRKRRKSHGHADRQQHFEPQYDVDGVPEEFRDFADGEQAVAGPVTVTSVTKVAADGGGAGDGAKPAKPAESPETPEVVEVVEVSEHSRVEEVADHAHVVAPVVTPGDVVAAEEADVAARLAVGDAQAHTLYVPHAGGVTSAVAADKEETEAEEAGQVLTRTAGGAEAEAEPTAASRAGAEPEPAEEAPKRRGLRVRRAAKRPAGPPASHG
ncbi:Rne/Rng family ribonuclease [Catenulispora subtropica]|uniref:S1 motif domain-containing protein n=1 Tax=Catenulispora subtropica TaxID=450798 RepID=A0ABP5DFC7_9ACTN